MKRFMNEIKKIFESWAVTALLVVAVFFMSISQTTLIRAVDDFDLNSQYWQERYEAMSKANEANLVLLEEAEAEIEKLEKEAAEPKEIDILKYAGELYDIDPKLLEAIERLESGNYTSNIYLTKNNTWGAFDGVSYKEFDSREQSTMELARTLRLYYYDAGLDTLEEIGSVYCPDNPNWAALVREIYEQL